MMRLFPISEVMSEHKDSEGIVENVDKNKLMFMKAVTEVTELVLFVTDEQAEIFKDGMCSGNQAYH